MKWFKNFKYSDFFYDIPYADTTTDPPEEKISKKDLKLEFIKACYMLREGFLSDCEQYHNIYIHCVDTYNEKHCNKILEKFQISRDDGLNPNIKNLKKLETIHICEDQNCAYFDFKGCYNEEFELKSLYKTLKLEKICLPFEYKRDGYEQRQQEQKFLNIFKYLEVKDIVFLPTYSYSFASDEINKLFLKSNIHFLEEGAKKHFNENFPLLKEKEEAEKKEEKEKFDLLDYKIN